MEKASLNQYPRFGRKVRRKNRKIKQIPQKEDKK